MGGAANRIAVMAPDVVAGGGAGVEARGLGDDGRGKWQQGDDALLALAEVAAHLLLPARRDSTANTAIFLACWDFQGYAPCPVPATCGPFARPEG